MGKYIEGTKISSAYKGTIHDPTSKEFGKGLSSKAREESRARATGRSSSSSSSSNKQSIDPTLTKPKIQDFVQKPQVSTSSSSSNIIREEPKQSIDPTLTKPKIQDFIQKPKVSTSSSSSSSSSNIPRGTISEFKPESKLADVEITIAKRKEEERRNLDRGAVSNIFSNVNLFGLGVASSGVGVVRTATDLISTKGKILVDTGKAVASDVSNFFRTGSSDIAGGISEQFKKETPSFVAGTIAGELAQDLAFAKTLGLKKNIKDLKYKTFGEEIPASELYSEIAMKSDRGLDLTYNAKKTISKLEEGFGKVKEGFYTGVSQSTTSDLGKKVLTREELLEKGIIQGSEPGLFVSPEGAGQTGFLGINKEKYKLSINPSDLFKKKGEPTTFRVLFENLGQYPKKILDAPLSQELIETFQKKVAPESKALITRMSSLGTKAEPEVIIPVTSILEPVNTKLQFTKFKDTIIPVKTIEVKRTTDIITDNIGGFITKTNKKGASSSSKYIDYDPIVINPLNKLNLIKDDSSSGGRTSSVKIDIPKIRFSSIPQEKETISEKILDSGKIEISEIQYKDLFKKSSSGVRTSSSGTSSNQKSIIDDIPEEIKSSTTRSSSTINQIYKNINSIKTPTTDFITRPTFKFDYKEIPKREKLVDSFLVQVRKKGKFETIGKPLSKLSALSLGAKEVTTSPSATFRLIPFNKKIKETKRDNFFTKTRKTFRKGKDDLTFVEKRRYRITTLGEIKGISLKGSQSKKKKKDKNPFKFMGL